MNEFNKILRWAAPGAVCLGASTLMALVAAVLSDKVVTAVVTPGLVAAAAAASVPVGFLLYQFYVYADTRPSIVFNYVPKDIAFSLYETSGIQSDDFQEPRIGDDKPVIFRGLRFRLLPWPLFPLNNLWVKDSPNFWRFKEWWQFRKSVNGYFEIREQNHHELQTLLWKAKKPEACSNELFRLSEIYHTLGASRLAIPVGYVVGSLLWIEISTAKSCTPRWFCEAVVILVIGFLYAIMTVVIHYNRSHTLIRRDGIIKVLLMGRYETKRSKIQSLLPNVGGR